MTAQGVPAFEWSERALTVRQFLYEHWCEHGRGPNLRDVHEALGLDRAEIIAAYKELGFGEIVFDQTSVNFTPLKCPPFSSAPTPVKVFKDDGFHAFAGCAMESVALSRMPPFAGEELRIESHCACCLAPITVRSRDGEVLDASPAGVLIHVSRHPDTWGIPDVGPMCDSMNHVLDADHAARFERMIARRGVVFDLVQARALVSSVAENRMWDHRWNPGPMDPAAILEGIAALGVDVSNWRP